jgi:hypothetical protein
MAALAAWPLWPHGRMAAWPLWPHGRTTVERPCTWPTAVHPERLRHGPRQCIRRGCAFTITDGIPLSWTAVRVSADAGSGCIYHASLDLRIPAALTDRPRAREVSSQTA